MAKRIGMTWKFDAKNGKERFLFCLFCYFVVSSLPEFILPNAAAKSRIVSKLTHM